MKIYLDNCALGRLTDNPGQQRIRDEADAVLRCLANVLRGVDQWTASAALYEEASRNRDEEQRSITLSLLATSGETAEPTPAILAHGELLERHGLRKYDALHIAFAESLRADVLLTTDDRLIRLAKRLRTANIVQVEVANPVDWLARRRS